MEVTRRTAIVSMVAAVASSVEQPVPTFPSTKSKYGVVFNGVDELIELKTPDDERTELARRLPAGSLWIVSTERGLEVWNGQKFTVSNQIKDESSNVLTVYTTK